MSGTDYNGAAIWFSTLASEYASRTDEGLMGVQFFLRIAAAWPPEIANPIRKVDIAGISIDPSVSSITGENVFRLQSDQSSAVFDLFMNDKPVLVTIYFTNGETRQTNISAKWREGDFRVWAAMLQTCRQEIDG